MGTMGLMGVVAVFLGGMARAELLPTTMSGVPGAVFVPPGFDNDDASQIVITGEYSNTCYKVGPTPVKVVQESNRIFIDDQAYYYDGMCLMMLVPYVKTVPLGVLPAGDYKLMFRDADGQYKERSGIHIATAPASERFAPDTDLYAPVNEVAVQNDAGGDLRITVSGMFTADCMSMDRVVAMERTPNVIEVLPIAKTQGTCHDKMFPFHSSATLSAKSRGQSLVHTRSMNGQAVNKVIDIR